MSTLPIKNMVCNRCKQVVQQELEQLGVTVKSVDMGKAVIADDKPDLPTIASALEERGFELIGSQEDEKAEEIKNAIIQFVHASDTAVSALTFSHYLEEKLKTDYHTLSALFSRTERVTIQQYHILQRIERAKELLTYGELSIGQIADQLNYRNTAHLSAQFKKVTGTTPSQYKRLKNQQRKPLDKILY